MSFEAVPRKVSSLCTFILSVTNEGINSEWAFVVKALPLNPKLDQSSETAP